mmetsp:Transcript_62113/g.152838  ORF Transcript_62113/g.152838 Transcript_62113/m.152838 type:complete len:82 (+) Transcript_62113:79-324(+)
MTTTTPVGPREGAAGPPAPEAAALSGDGGKVCEERRAALALCMEATVKGDEGSLRELCRQHGVGILTELDSTGANTAWQAA